MRAFADACGIFFEKLFARVSCMMRYFQDLALDFNENRLFL
jgi:hypothetical protein